MLHIPSDENKKGSVLIFTLFITMIVLVAGINIMFVVGADRQSSFSTRKSVIAFQAADTGMERALDNLESVPIWWTVIHQIPFFGICAGGEVTRTDLWSPALYTLTFYDASNAQLGCSDLISDIVTIKSVGSYAGMSRAIEVIIP